MNRKFLLDVLYLDSSFTKFSEIRQEQRNNV